MPGKDRRQEKRMTEDEMVRWQHKLNGREFEQTPRNNVGQGRLACCSPWGHKDWTRLSKMNNTKNNSASLMAQTVKTAMQETRVQSLGKKDPWRREWLPIPVFLPGKSLETEEPGVLVHGVTKSWT